jgi:predicted transcriptional regulator
MKNIFAEFPELRAVADVLARALRVAGGDARASGDLQAMQLPESTPDWLTWLDAPLRLVACDDTPPGERVAGVLNTQIGGVTHTFWARTGSSTSLRDTLIFVGENQNVTLSLPRDLLRRVKRLAADRDTSVSALMTEALSRLADEDRRYSAARKRALAAMKSARSLGTRGRRTWTRDQLHER